LSKEFLRQWLIEHNFMNEPGQTMPEITDEYAEEVSNRYIELYEHITGERFNKAADESDLAARIEKNVTDFLAQGK
jgi:phosphoribosylaminoimidazolesuccinocarboxamide synthase